MCSVCYICRYQVLGVLRGSSFIWPTTDIWKKIDNTEIKCPPHPRAGERLKGKRVSALCFLKDFQILILVPLQTLLFLTSQGFIWYSSYYNKYPFYLSLLGYFSPFVFPQPGEFQDINSSIDDDHIGQLPQVISLDCQLLPLNNWFSFQSVASQSLFSLILILLGLQVFQVMRTGRE